jgi:ABC-type spermidine/putrescine transport system permease subunit I
VTPLGVAFGGVALGYLALFYLLPIGSLLAAGGGWSTYVEVASNAFYWRILANTFWFAAQVTLGCLLVGYPVAYMARTAGPRASRLIVLLTTVPLWTSLLARTYGWLMVLDRRGLANQVLVPLGILPRPVSLSHTSFAALLGSIYIMLPLMVLALYAQMQQIDLGTIRAARTLGARPAQAFARVFLPLSLPGIVSGALLVFILSLGFFVTPALLGGPADRTFSMLIAQQIDILGNFRAASVLSIVLLAATLLLLVAFGLTVGFEQFTGGRIGVHLAGLSAGGRALTRALRLFGPALRLLEARPLWLAVVASVLGALMLPYVTLVPMSLSGSHYLQFPPESWSLRWYRSLIGDPRWLAAGTASLVIAAGATAGATVVGILASLGLRELPPRTARLFVALLLAPAMLPTMIYSIAAYFAAVKVGLVDTRLGLVLAHSVLGVPFVVVVCATALAGLSPAVEQAARSLGATTWPRLRRITLPLILPSVLVGAIMAFQTSFDEVVVALFLTGVRTRTLPKAMWQAATLEVTPAIPAVSVLVLLTIAVAAGGTFAVVWSLQRTSRHGPAGG